MKRPFNILIALMWLALPLTAWRYWTVWDQLPLRMATHFDANGHAHGWMLRSTSFQFALGLTGFVLVVFTIIAYVIDRSNTSPTLSRATLGFSYLMTGFIYFANRKVIDYNLTGEEVHADLVSALIPGAVLILVAIYLGTQRGAPLPAAHPISEEVHASRFWGMFIAVIVVVELLLLSMVSAKAARIPLALVSVILLPAAALAWGGFHYIFTSSGIEIRTLGFRLRSIPAAQVQHYSIASWSPLRGYGIRGIGNCRAYVWGNRGVRIQTSHGVVFLGHDEPERIVDDLDAMKQFAH